MDAARAVGTRPAYRLPSRAMASGLMTDAFHAGSGSPLTGTPEWEWGDDLCAPFVDLLPVSGASISVLRRDGDATTVCASDPLARRLDAMQFALGEGPRWVVARTGRPSISADVEQESHPDWPVFGAGLATLSVGALFAFPILVGPVLLGVIDLYRRTPGSLDRDATAQVLSLARKVAAPAVREAMHAAAEGERPEGKRHSLRREVHQAVGMVFVQLDVTTTEALALLRAYAFSTGRPLEDVAIDVVGRKLDFRDLPG
ncbi:GAF and ANTAR domain-containing protein [Microbacterium sp. 22195]